MMCSANEVMTLAAKAALGGGAPPAQASAFGRAALCHLIAGRSDKALADALGALPGGPILSLPLAFLALTEGTGSGSGSGSGTGTRATGSLPETDLTLSYAEAQPFATSAVPQAGMITVQMTLSEPAQIPPVARVQIAQRLADQMTALAAKRLVPESDASRLSGAGAGLTDND
jgi:hypothetical protein